MRFDQPSVNAKRAEQLAQERNAEARPGRHLPPRAEPFRTAAPTMRRSRIHASPRGRDGQGPNSK
jgi:hypothetical protein